VYKLLNRAVTSLHLPPGLAIKNPPKKTRRIVMYCNTNKIQKNPPKNPPQSGVFGFYWVILNLTSNFGAKVAIFF
jgi:hypothetical protein